MPEEHPGYLPTMAHLTWPRSAALGVLASLTLLAGCAQSAESSAGRVAEEFLQAVESGDGDTACGRLSPATRKELEQSSGESCAQAVLAEDIQGGSTVDVNVFDTMAQVKYDNDAIFLSHFDTGWLVTAAACKPVPGKPYDCSIKGS